MSKENNNAPNFHKLNHDCCLKCEHRFGKECDLHDFFIKGSLCEYTCDDFDRMREGVNEGK